MRIGAIVALLAATACASGGAPSSGAPASQTLGVVGPSGVVTMTMPGADNTHMQSVPFSVEQVWRVLPGVYDSIGVPVQTLDPVKHAIGNSGFAVRRRLKTTPLSRFIDCGTTQLGPNADDYDVRLTLLTEVRAVDGGSRLTTTLDAVARPANYAQEYSRCSSRGALEQRIIDAVQARLAR